MRKKQIIQRTEPVEKKMSKKDYINSLVSKKIRNKFLTESRLHTCNDFIFFMWKYVYSPMRANMRIIFFLIYKNLKRDNRHEFKQR